MCSARMGIICDNIGFLSNLKSKLGQKSGNLLATKLGFTSGLFHKGGLIFLYERGIKSIGGHVLTPCIFGEQNMISPYLTGVTKLLL